MTSRLQLHLSARDLKNMSGLMGRSDPFAVVTVRGDNENNKPRVVGQTDVVFNNLSPSWSRVIFLDGYKFGVPLYFEVGVFDFDATQTGKSERELSRMDVHSQALLTSAAASQMRNGKFPHKVMGTALFEVGQVLGARGNVGSKSLQTGGVLTVHVEKCDSNTRGGSSGGGGDGSGDGGGGRLHLHLRGWKLSNVQSLGRTSSPFYELYRKVERPTGATWESVYRSNTVSADLSPLWTEVTLDLEATCNSDLNRAMKMIVWDHRRSGKHKMMGEMETTVQGILDQADEGAVFEIVRDTKTVGTIQVVRATLIMPQNARSANGSGVGAGGAVAAADRKEAAKSPRQQKKESAAVGGGASAAPIRPEFVDYLSGGCQISLAVAIDFTASNGDPRQPGTPHYFHPPESKEWNDYEKAIFAVGSILAKYDSDQKFPVWGFGAKYNNVVRHCFQCGSDIEVEGVQGIMDAYRGVFRTPLTMSYPTKFTEVIQTAASYARHEQEVAEEEAKLSYTILLILTAGNIENVKETKAKLAEASEEPLSIVIVGIGDADFDGMEFLDEHDGRREGGRDITKFVRFSDYKSFNALTEAVLDEIPQQLVDYYFDRNILPGRLEDFNDYDVEIADADDDARTFTFLG